MDTGYNFFPQHFAKSQKMWCYEDLLETLSKFFETSKSDVIKFWASFGSFLLPLDWRLKGQASYNYNMGLTLILKY